MKKKEIVKTALTKELIAVAKVTPKSWGETILKRNKALLEKLELLKPYIGMTYFQMPTEKTEIFSGEVQLGCPHCVQVKMRCSQCIWTKHSEQYVGDYACLEVPFNEVSYRQLQEYSVSILYYMDKAWFRYYGNESLTLENYEEVENFLKGHIEWAKYILENGLEG